MKKIKIDTYCDERGKLSVIEKLSNFRIKRVYYIYNLKKNLARGRHKHKKTKQIFLCLQGKLLLNVVNEKQKKKYLLQKPNQAVILEPSDWHELIPKSTNNIILVLANKNFSIKDYIYEK